MNKICIMNKYILFLSVLILLYACNVSKNLSNQALIENKVGHIGLCSGPDFFTSKNYFRANSVGESLDMVISKKKALTNARAEIAASVKILVESVVDNYVKSSELNNLEQVEEHFEGLNREVIKQELIGIKTICEELTKTTEGKFKTYIAIELSAQKLVDKFHDSIIKDDLLMIDYDYEKFKDTFEKEMGKL